MLRKVFWRRPERPKARSLSDKELARKLGKRIADELPRSGSSHLRFYVRDGAVTIFGSVVRGEDRTLVTHLVRHTPGVVAVHDHLAVEEGDVKRS